MDTDVCIFPQNHLRPPLQRSPHCIISHLLPHLTLAQGPILSPICIPRTSSRESMFVKCMNWASSTLLWLLTRIWLLLNLSWEKNTELKHTVCLLCHWSRVGDTGDSISKQDIHKQRYTWSRNEKLKPGTKSHFPQQPAACWDPGWWETDPDSERCPPPSSAGSHHAQSRAAL